MSENHWHIRKEITWGHIVTTAMLVISAVMAWGNLNSEIAIIKVKQEAQMERDKRQDEELDDSKKETKEKLEKIDEKVQKILDHLIDNKEHEHGK